MSDVQLIYSVGRGIDKLSQTVTYADIHLILLMRVHSEVRSGIRACKDSESTLAIAIVRDPALNRKSGLNDVIC